MQTDCFLFCNKLFEVNIHSSRYIIKNRAGSRHYRRWKGGYGSVQKVHELGKNLWHQCWNSLHKVDSGWYLRTRSQCRHQQLHLVHKVSSLHLAPVDLFARPSEVTPLALLDDVALRQLFGLTAGELDQNFAAALRAVTHWNRHTQTAVSAWNLLLFIHASMWCIPGVDVCLVNAPSACISLSIWSRVISYFSQNLQNHQRLGAAALHSAWHVLPERMTLTVRSGERGRWARSLKIQQVLYLLTLVSDVWCW